MKFIKNINKYYEKEIKLIDNIMRFIKLNNAIGCSYRIKYYYKEGKLHRENDKPAIEYYNISREWYKNGLLHRENDKPAVVFTGGKKYWFINGKFMKRNFDKNNIVNNDKFFNEDGNEIH
jgi:hypothetical protein